MNFELLKAAYHCDLGEIQNLLEQDADPGFVFPCGISPVVASIFQGHICCTYVLCENLLNRKDRNQGPYFNFTLKKLKMIRKKRFLCICFDASAQHRKRDFSCNQEEFPRKCNRCFICTSRNQMNCDQKALYAVCSFKQLYIVPMVAASSYPVLMDRLIQAGEDPYQADSHHFTALDVACMNNNLEVLEGLLKCGVNPNCRSGFRGTAVHVAACYGHLETLKVLVRYRANIQYRSWYGETPLITAIKARNIVAAKYLIHMGAHVDIERTLSGSFSAYDKHVLIICLKVEDEELLKSILKRTKCLPAMYLAFVYAVVREPLNILKIFFEFEVDSITSKNLSHMIDGYAWSDLALAEFIKRQDCQLVNYYLSIRPLPKNETPLIAIINFSKTYGQYFETFDLFVTHGLLNDGKLILYKALLHAFVCKDSIIIKHLIGAGANVQDIFSCFESLRLDFEGLVEVLEESPLDVNLACQCIENWENTPERAIALRIVNKLRRNPSSLQFWARTSLLRFCSDRNYYEYIDRWNLPQIFNNYLKLRTTMDIELKNKPLNHGGVREDYYIEYILEKNL